MPKPSMTEEQKAMAIQLRSEGLSYIKIAAKISCTGNKVSESAVYKLIKPPPAKLELKAKPTSNLKRPSTALLPEYKLNTYAPIHRRSFSIHNHREFTRAEMYAALEEAVRNTTKLSA
jgi:transposase